MVVTSQYVGGTHCTKETTIFNVNDKSISFSGYLLTSLWECVKDLKQSFSSINIPVINFQVRLIFDTLCVYSLLLRDVEEIDRNFGWK